MAYLTVRIKDVEGHSTERLEGSDRLTVGRTSAASVTIRHESVSREHCAFVLKDDVWYIEDCGSANGTRVNNKKLESRTTLQERDIIKIGKVRLTFHVDEVGKTKKKQHSNRMAAIAIDDPVVGVPVRESNENDPSQAIQCEHCGTWFSVAHRLSADRMPCPRCDRQNTIPELIASASPTKLISGCLNAKSGKN
jgi:predicted component of type VI protein secretion system